MTISFFFNILLFLSSTWALTINSILIVKIPCILIDYEIRDLESNISYFELESLPWNVSNTLVSSNSSQCSGVWLLGGYGVTGDGTIFTRTYRSLPSHNMIYFSIDIWVIDLAEIGYLFKLYFDNHLVQSYSSNLYFPTLYSTSYLCGSSKGDFSQVNIRGKVAHNSSQLTIQILSLFNSATDSFSIGVRNVNLLFHSALTISNSACELVSPILDFSPSCLCPKGQYDSAGLIGCSACHSNCKTCSGSSSMDCTSCKAGYSYNGQTCFQCHATCNQCNGTAVTDCIRCYAGNYLYWNGTCQSTCNSPLVTRTEGEYKFCDLPCNSTDYYYVNNNTCQSNCPTSSSFIQYSQGDLNYCSFICDSSDFLYWNGSCLQTCPTSFQQSNGVEKYCNFYCDGGSYLYWNSTCSSVCPSPLIQSVNSDSFKFCNLPCLSGEFLLPNGSCSSQCGFQVNVSVDGVNFCNAPCPANDFYYQNGSCLGSCLGPFHISNNLMRICDLPCPINEYYIPVIKVCTLECPSGWITKQDGLLNYCEETVPYDRGYYVGLAMSGLAQGIQAAGSLIRSDSSGSVFKTALVKLVKYVKYIQVPLQEEIRDILDSNVSSIYSISTAFYYPLPPDLQEKIPKHHIPSAFEDQGLNSSYLMNNWNTITACLILFFLGLVSLILEKVIQKFKNNRTIILIMKKIRTITCWNFLLCIIFNNYDDFTLYAILEFQSVKFDSFTSFLSFMTCFCVSCAALYLLIMVYIINKQAIKWKTQIVNVNTSDTTNTEISFYNKWSHYQVTYAGYQNTSFMSQGYLFWFTCRVIVTYLVVGLLYASPLAQTIQLTLISILVVSYLLKCKPIKDRFSYYVSLLFEFLVLLVNISLLMLEIFAITDKLTLELQQELSYLILTLNIMIDLFGNLVMWLYIIITIRAAYNTSKKFGLPGKTNWLSVLVIAYQSPGMDFHELSNQEIGLSYIPKLNLEGSQEQKDRTKKERSQEIHSKMNSFTKLSSFSRQTLSVGGFKGRIADDLQTQLSISPVNMDSAIDSAIQRLGKLSFSSRLGKRSLLIGSEKSLNFESDIEILNQKKENYPKKADTTKSNSILIPHSQEMDKISKSKAPVDQETPENSDSPNQGLENEDSHIIIENKITFSSNFPQILKNEIKSEESLKLRITSPQTINLLSEGLHDSIHKKRVLNRTSARKSNILAKKSKIDESIRVSKLFIELGENLPKLDCSQHSSSENKINC